MIPVRVNIRSYQVGFGDCFLFSVFYRDGDVQDARHVLIDFGTAGMPEGVSAGARMTAIARDIAKYTDGKPFAVVATHRHKDHISGFATNQRGTASGNIIAGLKPAIVVQPWTEHPDLEETATKPRRAAASQTLGSLAPARSQALSAMQQVAASVLAEVRRGRSLEPETRRRLGFLGEDNVKNLSAVKNLMDMAGDRSRNHYVHAGQSSGLEPHLPGVTIDVLGPPTVEQHQEIEKQHDWVEDQFWLRLAGAADALPRAEGGGKVGALFPRHVVTRQNYLFPVNSRWFIYRSRRLRGDQMLRIVTMLDDAMNNTSVILLFRAGGKSFLFPGDAQWENWQYALSNPAWTALLEDVDVYKVGHHGSRNATPKDLWKLFKRRGAKGSDPRLTTLMSTMAGKHGHEENRSEVPRKSLVNELNAGSDLHTTETLGADLYFDTSVDLAAPPPASASASRRQRSR